MMAQNAVSHQYIGVATSVNQFSRQIAVCWASLSRRALEFVPQHLDEELSSDTIAFNGWRRWTLTVRLNETVFNRVRTKCWQARR
jgi:hypothetical protein